jgi:hypothetical protein
LVLAFAIVRYDFARIDETYSVPLLVLNDEREIVPYSSSPIDETHFVLGFVIVRYDFARIDVPLPVPNDEREIVPYSSSPIDETHFVLGFVIVRYDFARIDVPLPVPNDEREIVPHNSSSPIDETHLVLGSVIVRNSFVPIDENYSAPLPVPNDEREIVPYNSSSPIDETHLVLGSVIVRNSFVPIDENYSAPLPVPNDERGIVPCNSSSPIDETHFVLGFVIVRSDETYSVRLPVREIEIVPYSFFRTVGMGFVIVPNDFVRIDDWEIFRYNSFLLIDLKVNVNDLDLRWDLQLDFSRVHFHHPNSNRRLGLLPRYFHYCYLHLLHRHGQIHRSYWKLPMEFSLVVWP